MSEIPILEPMSTGDVIDRAVRLYRRNFTPLISIVALQSLIGCFVSMMFWYGYAQVLSESRPSLDSASLTMLALGGLGYPLWLFVLLLTVAGLTRVVGDHLMLGQSITFRNCLLAVRHKLGDITVMGLLMIAIGVGLWVALSMILLALIMLVGVVVGATAAIGMPQWAVATATTIGAIVAIAAGVFAFLAIISRVIFLPQVLMMEGQSVGLAFSRAVQLGKGNWHRAGAIMLFCLFVTLSIFAGLKLPLEASESLLGWPSSQLIDGPIGQGVSIALDRLSQLLVTPMWVVSYTLLYFDNRVRKEAYDVELLARDLAPGFYWPPTVEASAFGYQMPVTSRSGRAYTQTSPLGLAGYKSAAASSPAAAFGDPEACKKCGDAIEPGSRYCNRCGHPSGTPA